MIQDTASELTRVVDSAAEKLKTLDEDSVRFKDDPSKWSSQEILGHLIDSATNNHQRFIRAQEGDILVFPGYEQDHWVRAQAYNETPWPELVELWQLYNRHLAHVMVQVPEDKLAVECRIGPYEPVTLEYLIEDYLVHLKHHLKQIEEKGRGRNATTPG